MPGILQGTGYTKSNVNLPETFTVFVMIYNGFQRDKQDYVRQ